MTKVTVFRGRLRTRILGGVAILVLAGAALPNGVAASDTVAKGKALAFDRSKGNCLACHAIADGEYPVSRPLFFYVKKAHVDVIPGIKEYLNEFTSDKAWGSEGYLSEKGLIPMPDAERAKYNDAAHSLKPLTSLE